MATHSSLPVAVFGACACCDNTESTGIQRIIPGSLTSSAITAIATSPTKRITAFAETYVRVACASDLFLPLHHPLPPISTPIMCLTTALCPLHHHNRPFGRCRSRLYPLVHSLPFP